MQPILSAAAASLPTVHLASEHFFDDVVFGRLVRGEALPYPGGRSVLVEVGPGRLPDAPAAPVLRRRRAGLVPVLAHPERYEPVWKDDACLDPLLDAGAHLLLDVCALVGKYGRAPQRAAEKLLEEDAYEAACSDAHRPRDVDEVVRAIDRLEAARRGAAEAKRLLADGPRRILRTGTPRVELRALMSERIAVIGLGYVGLPVALAFARKFPGTVGFDIHREKVEELRRGYDRNHEQPEAGAQGDHAPDDERPQASSPGCTFFVVAVSDAGRR